MQTCHERSTVLQSAANDRGGDGVDKDLSIHDVLARLAATPDQPRSMWSTGTIYVPSGSSTFRLRVLHLHLYVSNQKRERSPTSVSTQPTTSIRPTRLTAWWRKRLPGSAGSGNASRPRLMALGSCSRRKSSPCYRYTNEEPVMGAGARYRCSSLECSPMGAVANTVTGLLVFGVSLAESALSTVHAKTIRCYLLARPPTACHVTPNKDVPSGCRHPACGTFGSADRLLASSAATCR